MTDIYDSIAEALDLVPINFSFNVKELHIETIKIDDPLLKYWLGKKQSSESNKKRSEALKGRVRTEQHRQNLSKAMQGNKNGAGHYSGGTTGYKHSEETKRKISEAHRRRLTHCDNK